MSKSVGLLVGGTGCAFLLRRDFESRVVLGEQEIKKGRFPMTPQPSDWRHLAEQASNEMNPEKMMAIISELNRVLEKREQTSRQQHIRSSSICTSISQMAMRTKLRPSKLESPVMERFYAENRKKSGELIRQAEDIIEAVEENVRTSRELVASKRLRRAS